MRRIYQHLKENWVRHGFETLAVLVGVLTAFALNNWNSNRLESIKEKELLSNIIEDLEYDHEVLSELIQQAITKQDLHVDIYKKSTGELEIKANEPFSSEILEFIFIVSKTWDNHQQLGEEISDRSIRSDLNSYFSDYHVTNNYVDIHNEAVVELRQYNRQHEILNLETIFRSNPEEQSFDPTTLIHSDRMQTQIGTKEFTSILVELFLSNQDAIQWMKSLSKRNEVLRLQLVDHLN